MSAYDREYQQIEDDFAAGIITLSEYNNAIRELARNEREEALAGAEEAAESAYNDYLGNW